jgi:hypothetical protein
MEQPATHPEFLGMGWGVNGITFKSAYSLKPDLGCGIQNDIFFFNRFYIYSHVYTLFGHLPPWNYFDAIVAFWQYHQAIPKVWNKKAHKKGSQTKLRCSKQFLFCFVCWGYSASRSSSVAQHAWGLKFDPQHHKNKGENHGLLSKYETHNEEEKESSGVS